MVCYTPLTAWRSTEKNAKTGKCSMVFNVRYAAQPDASLKLPCGQCVGCRLARSAQWAIRCVHEAQMHSENCFITLTYAPEHLPENGSLQIRDFQLFMKRLRKKFGAGIRFFHCGEYGENFGRPHYHACLFGFDFPDKKLWRVANGNRLYTSDALADLWPYGFSSIGSVTFESAAYVARYIMKKVTGNASENHYTKVDPDTGEIITRQPEYTTMSRRPGIAKAWFDKFNTDVYPHDYVVHQGRKLKPPKYYDRQYAVQSPFDWDDIKEARELSASTSQEYIDNSTSARLNVRMQVQLARLEKLKRTLT